MSIIDWDFWEIMSSSIIVFLTEKFTKDLATQGGVGLRCSLFVYCFPDGSDAPNL